MNKPWDEMTREERSKRLGDLIRWEQPAAAQDSWEAELVRRYELGLPLTKADKKLARRIAKR